MKKSLFFAAILAFLPLSGIVNAEEMGTVDIHGFISQGYLRTDHNNYMAETKGDGSFEFNELGLNFGTDLTDKLRLGMQFFARDLGEEGNDELVLDWAFADYRWRDWLGFRVGRVKATFGYYNAIRDFDMLRTSIFIPQAVYPEILRDTFAFIKGVTFYGYAPLGALGSLSYLYHAGIANVSEKTGLVGAQEDFWSVYNFKIEDSSMGRSNHFDVQWETFVPGLMLGGALYCHSDIYIEGTLEGSLADPLDLTYLREYIDFKGYFLLLKYAVNDFIFLTELNYNKVESMLSASKKEEVPLYFEATDLISQGWYASLSYRFHERFEAEYAYSVFYPDKTNKDGHGRYPQNDAGDLLHFSNEKKQRFHDFQAWKKTNTVSFRFDINENWLFKLEAAYNDGFGEYTSADNGVDEAGLKRYWWLYAAKVTYNF